MKHLFILLIAGALIGQPGYSDEPAAETASELPTQVVVRINGDDIPGEWFLHEFRSTFFRYPQADNVRQAVFEPFLKRMLILAKARELGIDRNPELVAEIDKRISAMRAFMEYQIEMTRIDMLNNALLKDLNLLVSPEEITDEDLEAFFESNIKNRPGAPPSFSMVPAHILDQLRQQAAQSKLEEILTGLVVTWRENMDVTINSNLVESVPMPEMKGPVPPGIGGR